MELWISRNRFWRGRRIGRWDVGDVGDRPLFFFFFSLMGKGSSGGVYLWTQIKSNQIAEWKMRLSRSWSEIIRVYIRHFFLFPLGGYPMAGWSESLCTWDISCSIDSQRETKNESHPFHSSFKKWNIFNSQWRSSSREPCIFDVRRRLESWILNMSLNMDMDAGVCCMTRPRISTFRGVTQVWKAVMIGGQETVNCPGSLPTPPKSPSIRKSYIADCESLWLWSSRPWGKQVLYREKQWQE